MRSLVMTSVLGLLFVAPTAFADPVYQFTLTGDGNTFAFQVPNPPTVTQNPHQIFVGFNGVPGTVNGVGGYTFTAVIVAEGNFGTSPVLDLTLNPPAPNIQLPFTTGADTYMLYGPTMTTLISDVPNPNLSCYPGFPICNDLLTFNYVPGSYGLYGYDPNGRQGSYLLNIATATATGVTPEPSSVFLLLAGAVPSAFVLLQQRRRGLA